MRRLSCLVLPCLCALALPGRTLADGGFGPVTRIGDDVLATPVSAALDGSGGAAVITAVARGPEVPAFRVVAASRAVDATGWHRQVVAGELQGAMDAQATVTPAGTAVVAWVAIGPGQRWYLRVATGRAGGDVRQIGRLPLPDPLRAQTQLLTLAGGRVLVVYRDGTRLTAATILRTRLGSRHVLSTAAGSIAAAAAGTRGVVVWLDPYRPGRPAGRRLWAARISASGRAVERPYIASRNASAAPQVGGGADGRVIATWLRPRAPGVRAAPFTRSLWPALRPARPLAIPADYPNPDGAPTVALAGDGSAVLALRLYGGGPPLGEALFAGNSRFGGVWARQGLTGVLGGFGIGAPRAAATGARAGVLVTTVPRPSPSVLRDVVVVDRSGLGVQTTAVAIPGAMGEEADLAAAGRRVLVAGGAAGGGFAVTERDG